MVNSFLKPLLIVLMMAVLADAKMNRVEIDKNNPISIGYNSSKPLVIIFNFPVKSIAPVSQNVENVSINTLPKGFVLISKDTKVDFGGVVIVENDMGDNYIINLNNGAEESSYELVDTNYEIVSSKAVEVNFTSTVSENEIKQLVKRAVLVSIGEQTSIKGYFAITTGKHIKAKDFTLERKVRYVGDKFLVDIWAGLNTTEETIYLNEADFYTKGIIAISPDKNRVGKYESFSLINVINKASVKNVIVKLDK